MSDDEFGGDMDDGDFGGDDIDGDDIDEGDMEVNDKKTHHTRVSDQQSTGGGWCQCGRVTSWGGG